MEKGQGGTGWERRKGKKHYGPCTLHTLIPLQLCTWAAAAAADGDGLETIIFLRKIGRCPKHPIQKSLLAGLGRHPFNPIQWLYKFLLWKHGCPPESKASFIWVRRWGRSSSPRCGVVVNKRADGRRESGTKEKMWLRGGCHVSSWEPGNWQAEEGFIVTG